MSEANDETSLPIPNPGLVVEADQSRLRLITPYVPGHPEGPWWAQAEGNGKTRIVLANAEGWASISLTEAEKWKPEAGR